VVRPSVRLAGALCTSFLMATAALWGQEYTGKLQGHIRNAAGQLLPNAQVLIPGTAYGASAIRTATSSSTTSPSGPIRSAAS